MYINLNELVHHMAASLFEQTVITQPPTNPHKFDEDQLQILALFCQIDLLMSDAPPSWVEIQGNEDYVKHSLLDIS
ncbi:MAG: hypothetical protein HBSAPP04_27230 [Ignavibacteriaceae bacterium]|nr:MAG: hypothetical protein HBSAPP04_27230 [Ignavibacteriaceae bacterium]